MAVDIEMKLFDIQERYRTLAMYKVEVVGVYFERFSQFHVVAYFV